ncbi:hypothetical protein FA95DRAFT_1606078 [Auriscalpium vulgare]|uniref:Uncharacterized protein n=1 Tax=Auriscalpium vulgare TaxID=40419 RepID=A0ACB8RU52_9AGAM|nr:hypothetical protein FA95DRAFT_1606078 [Auriscalpium vulgare]
MLIAFRDAVKGHRDALLVKGILHRDVSLFNIMFDKHARDGVLGRLIDFDLAKKFKDLFDKNATGGDLRTGTRMYQSVKVLSGDPNVFGVHDHMDDLESFFYVLVHLSTGFTDRGQIDAFALPPELRKWNNADADICADAKVAFMMVKLKIPMRHELITTFLPLIAELQQFFRPRVEAVSDASGTMPEPMPTKDWPPERHLEQAAEDYKAFLTIVDKHIAKIEKSPEYPSLRWAEQNQTMVDAAADWSDESARSASPTPSNASTVVGISRKRSQAFLEEDAASSVSSSGNGEINFAHDCDHPTVSAVEGRRNAELAGHRVNMGGVTALRAFLLERLQLMKCPLPGSWSEEVNSFVSEVDVLHGVPYTPLKENLLYDPYVKQSKQIARHFNLDGGVSVDNTSHVNIFVKNKLSVKPDLSFVDTTKRQDVKESDDEINYAHIRTIWDAKRDVYKITTPGLQLGMYARQILAEQPGRRFVITFAMSGTHMRLFIFDRCGVMYSDKVGVRAHPDIFVLAVLTYVATSPVIGMYPTIEEFTMSTASYWSGQLVVDGIKGVGHIRAYQDNLTRVSDVRADASRFLNDAACQMGGETTKMPDRIYCRQVLDRYTGNLSHAPDLFAMLVAFRDAVEGHRYALLKMDILHRDFQDLFDKNATAGDLRTGTRMYQSVKVLRGDPNTYGVRDHMDDLESFFYLLTHLSTVFTNYGNMDAFVLPSELQRWNSPDPHACALYKAGFMAYRVAVSIMPELLDVFFPLLSELQLFFRVLSLARHASGARHLSRRMRVKMSMPSMYVDGREW